MDAGLERAERRVRFWKAMLLVASVAQGLIVVGAMVALTRLLPR